MACKQRCSLCALCNISKLLISFSLRFGVEERSVGFPFVLEQQFKLAIALTPKEFRFAVDGVYFGSFAYRSEFGMNKMNGFKMGASFGMYLEITSVDHLQMDSNDCYGFEEYSEPDCDVFQHFEMRNQKQLSTKFFAFIEQ